MLASNATSALNVELQMNSQQVECVCIFTCKNVVKEEMNLEASVEAYCRSFRTELVDRFHDLIYLEIHRFHIH